MRINLRKLPRTRLMKGKLAKMESQARVDENLKFLEKCVVPINYTDLIG